VAPNAISGYHDVRLVLQRWTWAILLSPSAYIFLATVIYYSVGCLLQMLLLIPSFFARKVAGENYRRRFLLSCEVVRFAELSSG
jgi:hypothetical protein